MLAWKALVSVDRVSSPSQSACSWLTTRDFFGCVDRHVPRRAAQTCGFRTSLLKLSWLCRGRVAIWTDHCNGVSGASEVTSRHAHLWQVAHFWWDPECTTGFCKQILWSKCFLLIKFAAKDQSCCWSPSKILELPESEGDSRFQRFSKIKYHSVVCTWDTRFENLLYSYRSMFRCLMHMYVKTCVGSAKTVHMQPLVSPSDSSRV